MKLKQLLIEINKNSAIELKKDTEFMNWFYRFQTQKTTWVPTEYLELKNNYDIVNSQKNYTCYRGIFIKSPNKQMKSLKVGQSISDEGTSWSTDILIAKKFAIDDHYSFGSKRQWVVAKSMGIVIEYTFEYSDIAFDLKYMYEKGFKDIEYPKEEEIIVLRKQKTCKIKHIIQDKIINGKSYGGLTGI